MENVKHNEPKVETQGSRGPKVVKEAIKHIVICQLPVAGGGICGSRAHERYKTETIDGSRRRVFCLCRNCGRKFEFTEVVEFVAVDPGTGGGGAGGQDRNRRG